MMIESKVDGVQRLLSEVLPDATVTPHESGCHVSVQPTPEALALVWRAYTIAAPELVPCWECWHQHPRWHRSAPGCTREYGCGSPPAGCLCGACQERAS